MDFKDEILNLEYSDINDDYIIKKGSIPILFTAPHTMEQIREDGSIKLNEPFTKALALYLNNHDNVNCMIKIKDTGEDPNRDNRDEFKTELLRFIKDNDIKLVIDLHGASKERDFDVEFGTMNNLSADFSTIKELEDAFVENGITNISNNDPFKGGAITQYIFKLEDVDVIQLEINRRFRKEENIDNMKKLYNSLSSFIKQYKEYMNKR